jgi:hypothetical protein
VRGPRPAGLPTDWEGHQAPDARPSGVSRPPAALDHLTEQPGPGHTVMAARQPRPAAEWVLVRPLRQPHNAREPSDPTTDAESTRSSSTRHDQPPFVGVQLIRPARSFLAGCGRPNWTPPTRLRDWPATRNDPTTQTTAHPQRHPHGRRASLVHPLDTGGPHGCRCSSTRHHRHPSPCLVSHQ